MRNRNMAIRLGIVLCLLVFPLMELSAGNLRERVNFDEGWLFARFGLQPDGSRKLEPAAPWQPDFDDSSWRKLDLPHDWGIEGPFRADLDGYTGKLPWRAIGWYRKHFTVPESEDGQRFFLDFEGAMANAEVWLNGRKAGGWPYGYTSFRVDVTPYIRTGQENVVAVRLNTEGLGSRWYPGGGLYRHVYWVKTGAVHVDHWGVHVTTPEVSGQSAKVSVRIKLNNSRARSVVCRYAVDLYKLGNDDRLERRVARSDKYSLTVPAGGKQEGRLTLQVKKPELWSLEHTNRYLARVYVYEGQKKVDEYDVPFGIRTFRFTHDNGFWLNGKRVQIQGTCNHSDLGALGMAVNTAALRRQLTLLKDMGCNALRTSHNPPSPDLLDLADKMGFLVMDEAFDCWSVSKKQGDYASIFAEWRERDLEALVCRDRNHPSVILWSTGNEVAEQYNPETGMARHLKEVVRRFDTTRPVTFGASYPLKSAMNGTELQVDVHGMNYAAGVYGGPHFYRDFLNKKGHEHLSGYSSESSSTVSSRGEYFPRKYHVTAYDTIEPGWGGLPDQEFAALDRYPAICGEFVWTGFDYLGEPTPFNSDQSVLLNHVAAMGDKELEQKRKELEMISRKRPTSRSSYFGIIDMAGFPKDRYFLYQSHWLPDLPMVHILPHWTFPDRLNQRIPVYVYTSGDEAELFLNGNSMGRKHKRPYEYRLKWENIVYEPGELRVVAYKKGKPWAESSVHTTGPAVRIRLQPDKTKICADGEDLVFIRISFLDAEGREVPIAEPLVSCSIDGPACIVATDNGDPTCLQSFSEPSRPAFNGLCLAIVKADKNKKGIVHFAASAPGLPKADLELEIIQPLKTGLPYYKE